MAIEQEVIHSDETVQSAQAPTVPKIQQGVWVDLPNALHERHESTTHTNPLVDDQSIQGHDQSDYKTISKKIASTQLFLSSTHNNAILLEEALENTLKVFDQEMQEALKEYQQANEMTIKSAKVATATFTVALVSWSLRSGSLLASMITLLPAWNSFDPLPVLNTKKSAARSGQDAVDRLFDGSKE